MFSTERSDFAVPIIGYLLMAVILVMEALSFLYSGDWLDKNYLSGGVVLIISIILIIVGLVSLWKAYIVDGVSFLFLGATTYGVTKYVSNEYSIFIIVGIVFILIAAMAFRAKDILVLANDVAIGIGFILFGFFGYNTGANSLALIAAIFMFLAVAVSIFICYNDWSLVQDIANDYQEALLEEDGCCCDDDCGCGCHDDDCECGCHDGKECHCHDEKKE